MGDTADKKVEAKLSINAHALIRFFMPVPVAAILTTMIIFASVIFMPPENLINPSIGYVFSRVGAAIACMIVLGISLFHIWASVLSRCPDCGGACSYSRSEGEKFRSYHCTACDETKHPSINPHMVLGGLLFTPAGLLSLAVPFFPKLAGTAPRPVIAWQVAAPFGAGLVFLVTGLWMLGVLGWIHRRSEKRGGWIAKVPWPNLLGGCVSCAFGLLFICVSIDPGGTEMPEGPVPVALAGVVFLLAGMAILAGIFLRGKVKSIVGPLIGTLLLTAFAAVPVSISMHDGFHPALLASAGVIIVLAVVAWVYIIRRLLKK